MAEPNQWSDYIGRTQETLIEISTDRMLGLAALLDYEKLPWPAGEVPPTGQWCAMFPFTRQSQLGHDGHEKRGEFFPPIDYPRRMWAGGRIRFHQPLHIGVAVIHRSIIKKIENKQGKTGPMSFLTVAHEYLENGVLCVVDEQDIVYRGAATGMMKKPEPKSIPTDALQPYDWSKTLIPDSTLLFRYSAVSFNSHRIHFDQEYMHEEGYPGLLVHGPLVATMLIDLFQNSLPGARISQFNYTVRSPLFAGYLLTLKGRKLDDGKISLWAEDCEGTVSLSAELHTG